MVAGAYSEAANLDQAGQGRGGADPHFSAACGEMNTVVADQDRPRQLSGAASEDQIEGESRLARPGGTPDQDGELSDLDGGCVDAGRFRRHDAGSRTMKRAPAEV